MRFVATLILLAGAAFAANSGEPSAAQIDDIIAKFAAKEAAFAQARSNYTYRQTARVMSLDAGGSVTGKWEEVSDIVFSPEGKRTEKVSYAPLSTLTAFSSILATFRICATYSRSYSPLPSCQNTTFVIWAASRWMKSAPMYSL